MNFCLCSLLLVLSEDDFVDLPSFIVAIGQTLFVKYSNWMAMKHRMLEIVDRNDNYLISHNGLGLAEGGGLEARSYNLALMLIRSTNVE